MGPWGPAAEGGGKWLTKSLLSPACPCPRYRKMKERLGLTEIRKQANRMSFGEVRPLTSTAMGPQGPLPTLPRSPAAFFSSHPMAPVPLRPEHHPNLLLGFLAWLLSFLSTHPTPKGSTQPALVPAPCPRLLVNPCSSFRHCRSPLLLPSHASPLSISLSDPITRTSSDAISSVKPVPVLHTQGPL